MGFKVLGVTTEITDCQNCGKRGLKKTVALEYEDGQVVHYGVDCAAAAALGSRKKAKAMSEMAEAIEYGRQIKATHGAEVAAMAIWNKFGFLTCTKNGTIRVGSPVFGIVE